MPKINIDIDEDNFLPVYQHTIGSDYDVEFLYGSRDSGKSRHIAQILITICMAMPKFKCPMIRKVANTVLDSQYAMIKEICEEWKVDHLFKFKTSPVPTIRCVNGGIFLGRGLDDPKKIKSLTNPSHAWIEEGADITSDDWTIITSSLRSNYYQTQIWFSFNPDVPGIYEDFWLWKRYFSHTEELSFTSTITEKLQDGTLASLRYRCTHSTFYDNPWCPPSRKATYEGLARTSEYDYRVYCKGLWGTRKTGDEFLSSFKSNIHVKKMLRVDIDHILYVAIDSNVFPYCTATFWQMIQENDIWYARQVHEITAGNPDNKASGLGKRIAQWLGQIGYYQRLRVCGDRSTKGRNTIDDLKRSFFQIVNETITVAGWQTEDKFLNYAPAVSSVRDFVNEIFDNLIPGVRIEISDNCPQSTKDYTITKANRDGEMLKINKSDYEGGPSYQHNGHLTDTLKDMMVQAFHDKYLDFRNRHKRAKPGGSVVVKRHSDLTP